VLTFLVPGRLDTLTGGYGYDRRIIERLRGRGWVVDVHQLDSSFPHPTPAALDDAAEVLAGIPSGAAVLIDGLAYGAMPAEVEREAHRLRLIALVHHPLAAESGLSAGVAAALYESERRALAHARLVVVTSLATVSALDRYEVAPARIAVVEPGTDAAPLAHGSSDATVNLLCVGSFIPRKGHATLIRALARIPQRNWQLTCIGGMDKDPGAVDRLRRLLREENLEGAVRFAGEKDGPALALEYARADVFVLATEYEGYGMVVAEALAHGLPVISTPTGGIPSLVGSDAGILVPPGDVASLSHALSGIIGDAALRSRLSAGARRVRGTLKSWDDSAAAMSEAIGHVLS
jgi:glycosyltransferase involved in cell wall biosynthesis